jgi:hypothetical protein
MALLAGAWFHQPTMHSSRLLRDCVIRSYMDVATGNKVIEEVAARNWARLHIAYYCLYEGEPRLLMAGWTRSLTEAPPQLASMKQQIGRWQNKH